MPHVYYLPDDATVDPLSDNTILETSLEAGIPHTHVCGGRGRCSTCRVLIIAGLTNCNPRTAREQKIADRLQFSPDIRLACQTTITGDVHLRRLVLDDIDIELTSQLRPGAVGGPVGQEKRAAVLFADIGGFTSFAEKLPPYDVVHILNRYFSQMGQVIGANQGRIYNYMGDGLLALFEGYSGREASLRAIQAGLDMLNAMDRFKPYLQSVYGNAFREIRVGVHFGGLVIGTVGVDENTRETVVGDTVNFASRIEAANKKVGSNLLISEETYEQVREDIQTGKSLLVEIAGKSGEYMLYEVIGINAAADPARAAAA